MSLICKTLCFMSHGLRHLPSRVKKRIASKTLNTEILLIQRVSFGRPESPLEGLRKTVSSLFLRFYVHDLNIVSGCLPPSRMMPGGDVLSTVEDRTVIQFHSAIVARRNRYCTRLTTRLNKIKDDLPKEITSLVASSPRQGQHIHSHQYSK